MPSPERPSLTVKRRFNAAPEKSLRRVGRTEKTRQWFGPGSVEEGSVRPISICASADVTHQFNDKGR